MEDTDLRGLDYDSAREYILAFAVDAKRMDKEISEAGAELERWKERAALAEGKLAGGDASMAALAEAARAKAAEQAQKIAALEAERAELRSKAEAMRLQLPMIRASERSIDPDRLLAELQLMTGELLGDGPIGAAPTAPDDGGISGEGTDPGVAGAAAPSSDQRSAAATDADFRKLESEAKAESELEALKRRAAAEDAGAKP
jgi:hypothetical protein